MHCKREILSNFKLNSAKLNSISTILCTQPNLTKRHLETCCEWVFNQCDKLLPKDLHFAQLCWLNLLRTLRKIPVKSIAPLELIAWVCISSILNLLGFALPLAFIQSSLTDKCPLDLIVKAHSYVNELLEWDLLVPTAVEIQSVILEIIQCCEKESIMESANKYAVLMYYNTEIVGKGSFAIATAAVLLSLNKAKTQVFSGDFIQFMRKEFGEELKIALELINQFNN